MYTIIIIFLIIATIFAIGTLIYVVADVLLDLFRKEPEEEEKVVEQPPVVVVVPEPEPEPKPEPEPEPEPEPVPVIIPVLEVEKIDAVEADALIPDEVAMGSVRYESGAGHGKKGEINIGVIDQHFEAGEIITIQALKDKNLISRKDCRIKVLAHGFLTKSFTVKAEAFSVEAIKMIELMGGTVIILVD